MPTGHDYWRPYQELVYEILTYVFCPPLLSPEYEWRGNEGADRRDIIFENSVRSNDSFWPVIRERYAGEYPIFDAKNLSGDLDKQDVLGVSHYLKTYGCGMFGGLVIRGAEGKTSFIARREQWVSQGKMLVVLNDYDLVEMLDRRNKGQDLSFYIARKIAEFRMSL